MIAPAILSALNYNIYFDPNGNNLAYHTRESDFCYTDGRGIEAQVPEHLEPCAVQLAVQIAVKNTPTRSSDCVYVNDYKIFEAKSDKSGWQIVQ